MDLGNTQDNEGDWGDREEFRRHSSSGSSGGGGGYSYHPSDKSDKGMALKDLFELALTALAFLAFGLFKLNVIMCIFGNNGGMSTTAAAEAINANPPMMGKTSSRTARSLPLGVSTPDVLNVMSQRVLKSIEVFLALEHDEGECLRLTLCDNNRFSRRLSGTDRIWLPVWSLGLSWVAGRFSPSQHASAAMLEYLRASVLGLGNSECEKLYSRCSLEKIANSRSERSKRRKKRRHGDPADY
ncbi:hypothetical protein C0J52_17176 [Blattella germanica]|nr:hypothetical protein C0J52_17176 [Blattella germanica]